METPRAIAEDLADLIRKAGLSTSVDHSTTSFGASSYITAGAVNGKRTVSFGIRISDHAVGSTRYHRDMDRVQTYAHIGDDMAAFSDRVLDIAIRAKAAIGL